MMKATILLSFLWMPMVLAADKDEKGEYAPPIKEKKWLAPPSEDLLCCDASDGAAFIFPPKFPIKGQNASYETDLDPNTIFFRLTHYFQ